MKTASECESLPFPSIVGDIEIKTSVLEAICEEIVAAGCMSVLESDSEVDSMAVGPILVVGLTSMLGRLLALVPESVAGDVVWLTIG